MPSINALSLARTGIRGRAANSSNVSGGDHPVNSMHKKTKLFCLRGFMKSGTNWVGSLLESHDQISCIGEFHWERMALEFERLLDSEPVYRQHPDLPEDPKEVARRNFRQMISDTVSQFASDDCTWVGDRTPHTIEPLIFPEAPQICVIRDGRDVLISRVFHLYNWPQITRLFDRFPSMAEKLKQFQNDPDFFANHPELLLEEPGMVSDSIEFWAKHVQQDLETAKRRSLLPVHFVKYESIHHDTLGQRERMFEFLGVDPTRCKPLEGQLKPGFSAEAPNQFFRKGAVGDWENYFTTANKDCFKSIAGDLLTNLGYTASDKW